MTYTLSPKEFLEVDPELTVLWQEIQMHTVIFHRSTYPVSLSKTAQRVHSFMLLSSETFFTEKIILQKSETLFI